MFTMFLPSKAIQMETELQQLAEEWNSELVTIHGGFMFLPEYMMRIHGIFIEEEETGWRLWRELDATTWEDFMLMHITHRLAFNHGLLLHLDGMNSSRILEPTPDVFASFDLYADKVLAKEEGLVRDIKKNWIYNHRRRAVH